jgi:hypothetical protein
MILFLFSLSVNIIADEHDVAVPFYQYFDDALRINTETGRIENLIYKTIEDVQNSNLFGNIIDVIYPNRLIYFYTFIFKKDSIVYQIAAMSENKVKIENLHNPLEEINLSQFTAIGYYGIKYYDDREDFKMFRGPEFQTPFDFLHKINPENYVSIDEIEKLAGINLDIYSRGGFFSPFYLYICKMESCILFVLASPSENKNESYFAGGWSFEQLEQGIDTGDTGSKQKNNLKIRFWICIFFLVLIVTVLLIKLVKKTKIVV